MDKRILNKILAGLAVFLASLFWGFNYLAQQKASGLVDPFLFVAARLLLGSILIFIFIILKNLKSHNKFVFWTESDSRTHTVKPGLILGVLLMGAIAAQQLGIPFTTVSKAGFIAALNVVIVPIISVIFLGKKIKFHQILGVLGATLGIAMLTLNSVEGITIGDFFMLIGATLTAVAVIIGGKYNKMDHVDSFKLTWIRLFSGGLLALLVSIILREDISISTLMTAKGPIIYSGIFATGLAFLFVSLGQRYLNDISTSLLMSLESVFSALAGWIVLGQGLGFKEIIGCILVLISTTGMQIYEDYKIKKRLN